MNLAFLEVKVACFLHTDVSKMFALKTASEKVNFRELQYWQSALSAHYRKSRRN